MASILFLAGVLAFGSPAFSAESVANPANTGRKFASVTKIRGDVIAVNGSTAVERSLRSGDDVFVGERVKASASGEAVLKTEDAGYVAVRPNAEFVAENFAAEGKPSDNFAVRLVSGSLRVISGWIGKINKSEHKVVTNTATIGIRGTDHEPYVLSIEMARATGNKEGTYDKVNRGGTTLDANGNQLDIDSGRVGFAPKQYKQRALLTLMLPVLLEKVPEFYVPGEFDAELDQLSETADVESQKQLLKKQSSSKKPATSECVPTNVAKKWLGQLDTGIAKRDPQSILALFAPDVSMKASVRTQDGSMAGVEMTRDEFVQSTIASLKALQDYKQRRISIDAKLAEAGSVCGPIRVKSVVIEQGKQSGKPYRFEALEEYVLEWRENTWLATKSEATQR
jgi:hypothetical protein